MEESVQFAHTSCHDHPPEALAEYLSIAEAGTVIGVAPRSVYGYVQKGKLPGMLINNLKMVRLQDAQAFKRTAPGRIRLRHPRWRRPPQKNLFSLTTVTIRLRPGQGVQLKSKLEEMRQAGAHGFPGTVARYIVYDQHDPGALEIFLFWRETIKPSPDECETALKTFYADFANVLEVETASIGEGKVFMYA